VGTKKTKLAIAALLLASLPSTASARGGTEGIDYNEPDDGNARIAATGYYALLGRSYLNWGGHGQITLVPTPALELKGAGMLSFPGSGLAFFRMEGSAYFAITSLDTADVVTGVSSDAMYTYTRYIPVPSAKRKKFGLEIGGFLDRHGVYLYPMGDWRHDEDPAVPITQLGGFGGFKWVRQTHVGLTNGASNNLRVAYFIHAMYALNQSVALPDGETTEPAYTKFGGRMGVEMGGTSGTGVFMRAEGGAMPSIRGPDWNLFIMLGLEHAESLF
jgi:hypothetical protein